VKIELYSSSHLYAQFDCGVEALNKYLQSLASPDIKRGMAQVYIAVDKSIVVGYYSLSPFSILFSELPEKLSKKYPPNKDVPCWLIGKLARSLSVKGQGIGEFLLLDAMKRIKQGACVYGGFCIIVDTKDDKAARFYKKYGFEILDEAQNTRRYYLPIAEIPDF
jgi:GNAT superfamily N-acetyltransferase